MKKSILIMMNAIGIGGVEKAFLNLISLLNQEQFNVTVLFYKKEGEFLRKIPSWIKVEEMKIASMERNLLEFGCKRMIVDSLKGFQLGYAIKLLFAYLKRKLSRRKDMYDELFRTLPSYHGQYDFALDFYGHSSITTYYISEKVNANIKATWLHRADFETEVKKFLHYYQKYDRIFGVSKACVDEFKRIFPDYSAKCETFHNILLAEDIKCEAEKDTGFDREEQMIKLLTVGRLVYFKGYDLAISVAAKLKEDGFKFRWYVIGDGTERKKLEELIQQYQVSSCFILLGKKSNPYPYMKDCDIYVQCSRTEGYCITLAEARMLNRPIVTTNFFGAQEQIVDGETGLIVNFNEQEMYEAIKSFMMNQQFRTTFEKNLARVNRVPGNEGQKLMALLEEGNKKIYEVSNLS